MKALKTKFGTALLIEWIDGLVYDGRLDKKSLMDRDVYFVEDGEHLRLVRIDDLNIDNTSFVYKKDFVYRTHESIQHTLGKPNMTPELIEL